MKNKKKTPQFYSPPNSLYSLQLLGHTSVRSLLRLVHSELPFLHLPH